MQIFLWLSSQVLSVFRAPSSLGLGVIFPNNNFEAEVGAFWCRVSGVGAQVLHQTLTYPIVISTRVTHLPTLAMHK